MPPRSRHRQGWRRVLNHSSRRHRGRLGLCPPVHRVRPSVSQRAAPAAMPEKEAIATTAVDLVALDISRHTLAFLVDQGPKATQQLPVDRRTARSRHRPAAETHPYGAAPRDALVDRPRRCLRRHRHQPPLRIPGVLQHRVRAIAHCPTVYGVLSLIVWSLILVVSVKYIVFVMRADNRGEGGILALLACAATDSDVAAASSRCSASSAPRSLWRRCYHARHFRARRDGRIRGRHAGPAASSCP